MICKHCSDVRAESAPAYAEDYDDGVVLGLLREGGSCRIVPDSSSGETGGVEHPAHYAGGVECIDAMAQTQGREAVRDFCVCNAFKYLWRWRHKGGVEDVRKARWYLDRFLEMEGDGDGE